MAFEALPATGAGSAEAGRVVRASWGEQVRLNFDDHEERLQDVEAAISFEFQGEWDSATAYNAGDVVTHNGSLYRASASIPVSSPPDTPGDSPSDWVLLVSAGTDGSADVALDIEAQYRANQGLGVYSGCAVTEDNAGAGLDVDVSAGHIRLTTGAGLLVTAGEVTLDAAHATLARIDIVWVNTSGTLGKTTGTASSSPTPPTLPSNSVLLASVARAANDNTVINADITDKRHFTRLPQIIRKASNEIVNASDVLQDDNELKFTVAASEVWTFEFVVHITGNETGDFKVGVEFITGGAVRVAIEAITNGTAATANAGTILMQSSSTVTGGGGFLASNSATATHVNLKGAYVNSTTAGTTILRWAQSVSNGTDTVVLANSHLMAFPVF